MMKAIKKIMLALAAGYMVGIMAMTFFGVLSGEPRRELIETICYTGVIAFLCEVMLTLALFAIKAIKE